MTAIAGMLGLDGRPCPASRLSGVLDVLAPLGRDGEGRWSGTVGPMGIALGAVRRRRVPEDDADTQPLVLAGGQVVVVADVVLVNRPELCHRLGLPDTRGLADPAVVGHAYLRWGEAACEYLDGQFAIAVADRRRGGVLLARDHTGARPLHLHRGRGWLGFATTALALTGFAGVPAELDLDRAREFLALVMATRRSWVRDVEPVPPATALWISPDGPRPRRYWNPRVRPLRCGSAAEHAEELLVTFDRAVRARLRRRGGIGVLLSGGLDSTAVAATLAGHLAPEPVRTYTAVPPPGWRGPATGRDPDESRLVRLLAARHPNLLPAFLDARGAAVVDGDPELYAAGATPVRNTVNMTWIRAIHRRAAGDGVGVLFSGASGNVAFSRDGRRWLADLLVAGRLAEAAREARAWSAARGVSLAATIRRGVLRELVPGWALRARAARRGQPAPPRWSPLDRAAGAAQAEALAAQEARWGWWHADPTADVRLLEVCARQPSWARRDRGVDRAAARAAMRGRVPDEIRLRRVRGDQLPDWLDRLTDHYVEICQELAAAHGHGPSRALIDLDRLDTLVRDWPTPDRAGDRDRLANYRLVLPRALAVSRYLRWFDQWAHERRSMSLAVNNVR